MTTEVKTDITCGNCTHGTPYKSTSQLTESLKGFLVCSIKQSTPEEIATLMTPIRKGCNRHSALDPA